MINLGFFTRFFLSLAPDICKAHLNTIALSNALRYGNTQQAIPAFTPQLQSITAIWLVLILPSHGG